MGIQESNKEAGKISASHADSFNWDTYKTSIEMQNLLFVILTVKSRDIHITEDESETSKSEMPRAHLFILVRYLHLIV